MRDDALIVSQQPESFTAVAPALALADVGIAIGSAGATVASETADAVILVDRIDRLAEAVAIGRKALRIARQSVLFGIGMSLVAMVFAGTPTRERSAAEV